MSTFATNCDIMSICKGILFGWLWCWSHVHANAHYGIVLGFIYIGAKATSLLSYFIVSNLCIYTKATTGATKVKEKFRLRPNTKEPLGFIYTEAKATSLPTSYIVSNLCIYTAATARSKKKNRFGVRFRCSINEPLGFCMCVGWTVLFSHNHCESTLYIMWLFVNSIANMIFI